jgi:hypothetical protein
MRAQTLPAQFSAAEDLVLKSFDRWAKESGARIGSIRPQWKADEPGFTLLECRADASGNLPPSPASFMSWKTTRSPLKWIGSK